MVLLESVACEELLWAGVLVSGLSAMELSKVLQNQVIPHATEVSTKDSQCGVHDKSLRRICTDYHWGI